MKLTFIFILAVLGFTTSTSYNGYKVYKVIAKTEAENTFLRRIETHPALDFWSRINKVGNPVTIMASPEIQEEFERGLKNLQIQYSVEIDDVQRIINAEKDYHKSRISQNGRISFDQYLRYDEINAYLNQLASDYPNLVSVRSIGQSYEGRDINIIRISTGPQPKPVLFIEGGNHAREWISPAFSLYIISQLVENEANRALLNDIDWVVLPLLNPDGYEYTWTTNRMWRKTRSLGLLCDGVDGNRNFGFYWMENGASSYECSETYAGPNAFSEPEARNLRDILDETDNIAAFISIHSYGQYLFYPYSYDNVVPDNWRELDDLARRTDAAIAAVNGTRYQVGASTEVLYPAAGCSDDWAMGGAGIDIVLTFELPGGGSAGFDLPPARILPVSIETWEGVKVIANYVAEVSK